METLIDKIQKFGSLSYEAGVHEKEEAFLSKTDAAKECFREIVRVIGKPRTIEVPCKQCADAALNERNYCHYCGRRLTDGSRDNI